MIVNTSLKSLLLASLLVLPLSALAGWQLDGDDSSVQFVSVKKSSIVETHHFKELNGKISDDGKALLEIALSSVETNIPIRNERMQQMLFNTAKFASATINATVDTAKLKSLAPGKTMPVSSDLSLEIHGSQKSYKADLQVTGLENGGLLVTTTAPIVVNAGDFKLLEGIEKLRQVAGLDSISPLVPVSVKLVFKQD
ncbi:YceI family protein [Microbulbifer bruguierae]|uniref:YceI family protein n=1 Tax=Microbulbifer bruguierae TaxID=3029061 RepID=A0ABY8NG14_9GAMM|nr:YceI family protein [Microbulbifer bruguierae]WGL17344.1 YceI family protein [Microbulbifer bruguierae]